MFSQKQTTMTKAVGAEDAGLRRSGTGYQILRVHGEYFYKTLYPLAGSLPTAALGEAISVSTVKVASFPWTKYACRPRGARMKRILIIGPGGSGKSTLATLLGEMLAIDVIHLDKLYWRPGWIEPGKDEWRKLLETALERASWIMDGNYSGTLSMRMRACDTVIFLDLPRLVCLWRVMKRLAMHRNGNRPDMASGCEERFSLEFLMWVWNYRRRTRPKVLETFRCHASSKRLIQLRSAREVEAFLRTVHEDSQDRTAMPKSDTIAT